MKLLQINNDMYGNPRFVVHFLNVLTDKESNLKFSEIYDYALKKAKLFGGKKYHNKSYGGGIAFTGYDEKKILADITKMSKTSYETLKKEIANKKKKK